MSGYSASILRLVDANLDRLSEGLRMLEDVARFILEDTMITDKLRGVRHRLRTDPYLREKLLATREAETDIGRRAEGAERVRGNITDVIVSNAKRAEESLRVLEEFAKVSYTPLDLKETSFQEARFTLYEIEKELTLKLARRDQRKRITGLYVILDADVLGERNMVEVARQVTEGGARVIQLRDKHRHKGDLTQVTWELKPICTEAGVLFLINNHIDIALATDVNGVHIGHHDLPTPLARRILPINKLIGRSVRTVEQARQAEDEGADYLGVGSIYLSPTKPNAEVIGLKILHEIKAATSLPVVAIGGINHSNADQVISAGADGVAVIDAVLYAEDISSASLQLAEKLERRG